MKCEKPEIKTAYVWSLEGNEEFSCTYFTAGTNEEAIEWACEMAVDSLRENGATEARIQIRRKDMEAAFFVGTVVLPSIIPGFVTHAPKPLKPTREKAPARTPEPPKQTRLQPMLAIAFSRIVRVERFRRGWSHSELAQKSGIPLGTMARMQSRRPECITSVHVERLAKAFEMTAAELMRRAEEELANMPRKSVVPA